jgi:drug/metabolite transporter (DMT)-like permease
MLKAFTPVSVLALSVITSLERASCIEVNIVLIICVGVALTSIGELEFSMVGFSFQVVAIMFESGRLVMTNIFLKQLGLDSLSTLYYIAPLCGCLIGCACFAFELRLIPLDKLMSVPFWVILVANGTVAFLLNIASVMLIKHTSALTLTLAGVIKDILLVVLSLLIFKSPVTPLQFLGYSVSLLALNLHKEYKKNSTQFEAAPAQLLPLSALSSSTTATIGSLGSDPGGDAGLQLVSAQDPDDEDEAIDVENENAPLLQV